MYALRLAKDATDADFREAAKRALAQELMPRDVAFVSHDSGIFFDDVPDVAAPSPMTVSRDFVELVQDAICHRAEDRFALLYDVLWRLKHGAPDLLGRASDPAVARLGLYVKAVRRDIHKMHAFVRFHKKDTDDGELYVAWFEPDHFILKRAAPFFADRFANMRWIIATPIGTATWDLKTLNFGLPRPKPTDLADGVLDGLWRTYYRTIFNPARLKTDAMTKEMPRRYWKNLPESDLIPELIEGAQARVAAMDREADQAPRFADKARPRAKIDNMPKDSLSHIRKEAEACTDCPLYKHATQTVFGEGPAKARVVLVGEQPGDQEDLAGKPFVGPAGHMLNKALEDAGIEREKTYVTNAVKHFKFEPRGKRRIHSKPNAAEIKICHQWIARELDAIAPEFVIALGATAAQSLMGKGIPIGKNRGRELTWADGRRGLITVHPSYLLRLPDDESKTREYKAFVDDLKLAAKLAAK